jgi:hypothetical protein
MIIWDKEILVYKFTSQQKFKHHFWRRKHLKSYHQPCLFLFSCPLARWDLIITKGYPCLIKANHPLTVMFGANCQLALNLTLITKLLSIAILLQNHQQLVNEFKHIFSEQGGKQVLVSATKVG